MFYDVFVYVRAHVVLPNARARAPGRGEETQCSRDEEKDSASRPRAAEVWNDREARKKQKNKKKQKRQTAERGVSERINARRELSERRYANV